MSQWVEPLAIKADDWSSIPKTHMVERKNEFPQVPSDLDKSAVVCTNSTPTYTK